MDQAEEQIAGDIKALGRAVGEGLLVDLFARIAYQAVRHLPGVYWATITATYPAARPRPTDPARIDELTDASFTEAAAILDAVVTRIGAAGEAATPQRISDDLTAFVRRALLDAPGHVGDLPERVSLRVKTSEVDVNPGQLFAIPTTAGNRLVLVLSRHEYWGTAVALWPAGTTVQAVQEPGTAAVHAAYLLYTDDQQMLWKRWRPVGAAHHILARLPAGPEIYFHPEPLLGDGPGDHGSAERPADGTTRKLTAAEARAVGLTDHSYRQSYASDLLAVVLGTGDL